MSLGRSHPPMSLRRRLPARITLGGGLDADQPEPQVVVLNANPDDRNHKPSSQEAVTEKQCRGTPP